MPIVYRVQDNSNTGPYNCQSSWIDRDSLGLIVMHTKTNGRPEPYFDGFPCTYEIKQWHRFAFDSIQKLKKWFTNAEIKRMKALGYAIFKVYVDELEYVLDHQVIFDTRKVVYQERYGFHSFSFEYSKCQ